LTRLDGLVGVYLHLRGYGRPLSDYYVVAERAALQDAGPRLDVGVAADEGANELRALAYVGPLSDHAALHRGASRDDDVVGDHRVGAYLGALVDADVLPDHDRSFELVLVEHGPATDVDVLPEARARRPDALYAAVEHVALRTCELLQGAYVLPVILRDVAVERTPGVEELGEELFGEVVLSLLGDLGRRRGLEQINTGVHGI
jgi:hypothetical protein